jgi:hypothetical protein
VAIQDNHRQGAVKVIWLMSIDGKEVGRGAWAVDAR